MGTHFYLAMLVAGAVWSVVLHGCILHVLVPQRASPGTCSSGQRPARFLAEMCC